MVLNEKTFLPNLFQTPPNALDVLRCHSPIGLIKINPESHSICHRCKSVNMASYRFTALIVKGSNAILFDITFTRETEFLFNCDLNGKSVTIPTSFASYIFPLHRLKAREDIFKYASFNVVGARHSVCSRRTFIESPRCLAFTRLYRFFKNLIVLPEI